jgi:hypothetical protein
LIKVETDSSHMSEDEIGQFVEDEAVKALNAYDGIFATCEDGYNLLDLADAEEDDDEDEDGDDGDDE